MERLQLPIFVGKTQCDTQQKIQTCSCCVIRFYSWSDVILMSWTWMHVGLGKRIYAVCWHTTGDEWDMHDWSKSKYSERHEVNVMQWLTQDWMQRVDITWYAAYVPMRGSGQSSSRYSRI